MAAVATNLLRVVRALLVVALPLALVTVASPASALGVTWDLTAGGDFGTGDLGSGVAPDPLIQSTKEGVTLSLTALTAVENGGNFDLSMFTSNNPMGLPGHVFIDTPGAGVKGFDGSGSKEVSGRGPLGDEVLILSFDRLMNTLSTSIFLEKYDESKDDIFIYIDNTLAPQLGEVILEAAMQNLGGDSRRIDFSNAALAAALTGIDSYETLYLRAQEGHFEVSSFMAKVPEPGTLVLIGMGFSALVLARRRKQSAG